jgi:hypothetical protein
MEEKKPKRSTWKAEEMRWLGENRAFLEENYPGKYIAVDGSRLVGVGDSMMEARDQALKNGVLDPLFSGVKDREFQGIYLIRHARES